MEDEKKYGLVEWTIENFSCFSKELHGEVIRSPIFNHNFLFHLIPESTSGRVSVEISKISGLKRNHRDEGILTFVGPNGFIIHKQRANPTDDDEEYVDPEPTLEELIMHIKKHKQDQLTLQYRVESQKSFKETMLTTIEIVETEFSLDLGLEMNPTNQRIADIDYTQDKKPSRMHLNCTRKGNKVELQVEPSNYKRYVLVRCRLHMDNEWTEEEQLFCDDTEWLVVSTRKEYVPVLLKLTIITGNIIKKSFRRLNNYEEKEEKPNVLANSTMPLDSYDVLLRCGSVTFATKKNVLSAWSPVFDRLFSNSMTETKTGNVDIEDLDPPTLARFMSFLHTATVEQLTVETAVKLFYAADKYDVTQLKKECKDFLCDNMDVSNVCTVLSLGNKHSDLDLVLLAQNFILDNFNSVLASEEWQAFKGIEPLLAVDTITNLAQRNCLGKLSY